LTDQGELEYYLGVEVSKILFLDSIPGFSITVDEFKKKLDTIYRSTELPSQFYSVYDSIRDIILKDLIREDEERMQTKDVWKDHQTYDRSFSFPEVLEHDK